MKTKSCILSQESLILVLSSRGDFFFKFILQLVGGSRSEISTVIFVEY